MDKDNETSKKPWKKFKVTCYSCGKQEHKKADCWELKGKDESKQNKCKCCACNQKGHIAKDCLKKKKDKVDTFFAEYIEMNEEEQEEEQNNGEEEIKEEDALEEQDNRNKEIKEQDALEDQEEVNHVKGTEVRTSFETHDMMSEITELIVYTIDENGNLLSIIWMQDEDWYIHNEEEKPE